MDAVTVQETARRPASLDLSKPTLYVFAAILLTLIALPDVLAVRVRFHRPHAGVYLDAATRAAMLATGMEASYARFEALN